MLITPLSNGQSISQGDSNTPKGPQQPGYASSCPVQRLIYWCFVWFSLKAFFSLFVWCSPAFVSLVCFDLLCLCCLYLDDDLKKNHCQDPHQSHATSNHMPRLGRYLLYSNFTVWGLMLDSLIHLGTGFCIYICPVLSSPYGSLVFSPSCVPVSHRCTGLFGCF